MGKFYQPVTYLVATLLALTTANCMAQTNAIADSANYQLALNSVRSFFNKSVNEQRSIYNGTELLYYSSAIKGSAFYIDRWTPGKILYKGVTYEGMPMLYDQLKDVVAISTYYDLSKIVLESKKISDFYLNNHHFVYVAIDSINMTQPAKSGFYDELYRGRVQVLVKRYKKIQTANNPSEGKVESFFEAHNEYYLVKGNGYYRITSEGSLLDALKEQKQQLQQFIRSNKIKFKNDPERTLVALATYYDELSN